MCTHSVFDDRVLVPEQHHHGFAVTSREGIRRQSFLKAGYVALVTCETQRGFQVRIRWPTIGIDGNALKVRSHLYRWAGAPPAGLPGLCHGNVRIKPKSAFLLTVSLTN